VPLPPALGAEVLRGLVDATPDALLAVDTADGVGRVCFANLPAATLFGHTPDDLVGRPVGELVPEVHDEIVGAPWARSEVSRLQGQGRRADGTAFPVEASIRPVATAHGVLACTSLRDLSGRTVVERASERLREELIASVSHELRTPLTSILGYTEILVDLGEPVVSEEARRLLAIVRRNAERQLKVVEDLLTLSVLGGGGVSVDPVPTDLGRVLRTVLTGLAPVAAAADVALVPVGIRAVRVFGDVARLTEVVDSLVRNAVKFSRPGDEVTVQLEVAGDHCLLEVGDHGDGAAPPGSTGYVGLGEPVLRGIVEAHAGELGVDHQPGQGTTVRVRLPRALG
jgi:two-component system phosphate regulon sensor histidine kinase PhoR